MNHLHQKSTVNTTTTDQVGLKEYLAVVHEIVQTTLSYHLLSLNIRTCDLLNSACFKFVVDPSC